MSSDVSNLQHPVFAKLHLKIQTILLNERWTKIGRNNGDTDIAGGRIRREIREEASCREGSGNGWLKVAAALAMPTFWCPKEKGSPKTL
jgi:hypothetical protein